MSQFKQMLADAAATFEKDDDVRNVIVIVAGKEDADGNVQQHVFTNIAFPLGSAIEMLQYAAKQIAQEKKARLGRPAANES